MNEDRKARLREIAEDRYSTEQERDAALTELATLEPPPSDVETELQALLAYKPSRYDESLPPTVGTEAERLFGDVETFPLLGISPRDKAAEILQRVETLYRRTRFDVIRSKARFALQVLAACFPEVRQRANEILGPEHAAAANAAVLGSNTWYGMLYRHYMEQYRKDHKGEPDER